jgi:hypothetical protein
MIGIIHTGFIGIGNIELSCTLPFLAYMIGISFTDFRMNIDNTISTNTITSININIHHRLVVHEKLPYTLCVIQATIDEKISIDIPLAIHFSVINSHNHINNTEPIVIADAANIKVPAEVSITFPHSE